MADHPELSSTRDHPVLRNGQRRITTGQIKPERLFHIKLEVVEGVDQTSSIITLLMRDDNLDVIGFINNQDGGCYELGDRTDSLKVLPLEYGSKILPWGKDYGSILNDKSREEAEKTLGSARLGKIFLADAVRVLSRFTNASTDNQPRVSLLVLMVMACDSARMEPVRDAIAGGWDNGTGLTKKLKDYRRNWPVISGVLLDWRDHAYQGWPQNEELEKIGIRSPEDALKVVPLVFNDPC
jgi:hypothetical protein